MTDNQLIGELARLDALSYARRQREAAKTLGISTTELRKIVEAKRHAIKPDADDGQGRAVKFTDPLPWHEPISGDRIATTLAAAIKTYVVLSDEAADTIALWVLHTWVVNAFTMSPRLALISPTKGCGKTTVLRLLNHVVRRPKRSGSISPASLFRVVEGFQPTILLDETEKYIENGSDFHALLNEGHCKGGTLTRVIGDRLELRDFSLYGAVALARNGKFPDDLEQRSIVIEMQRRRATEELAVLRDDRAESLRRTASMCRRWADDHARLLPDQDPDMDMINRNADNWRPLFAIADLCGEDWPDRVRAAAAALAPREVESIGPKLLADIRSQFDEQKTDRMFSTDLCEVLARIEGRPWAEWGKTRKPITKNQLAGLLKPFHVAPETIRIGADRFKGYQRHQFAEVFARYLAADPLKDDGVASSASEDATDDTEPPHGDDDVAEACGGCDDAKNPRKTSVVAPVAAVAAFPGNGGDHAGLSERDIHRLARELDAWIEQRRSGLDLDDDYNAEARRLIAGAGVLPDKVEVETQRMLDALFRL